MADLTKIWGAVGALSFGESGGAYDGLRDISMISMLFSQIFVKKPTSLSDIPYAFAQAGARNVHESPLLDYSTTTIDTYQRSASLLSNGQASLSVLKRPIDKAATMFKSGAFLHQYLGTGLEADDFVQAFQTLGQCIKNYEGII